MRQNGFRLIVILLLAGIVSAAGTAFWLHTAYHTPLTHQGGYLKVTKGESFHQVCQRLVKQNMLSDCLPHKLIAKFDKKYSALQAGVYTLKNTPLAEHVARINGGQQATLDFTVIAGWHYWQLLEALKSAPFLEFDDKALKAFCTNKTLSQCLEGQLLAETYQYHPHDDAMRLITRAIKAKDVQLAKAWQARDPALPYQSKFDALIMASIIEKETGQADERPLIASVFVNRLNKKMRLQTDPTVIYGIGPSFNGDITRADLKTPTPYNTYRINGLPPTPIAMVSAAAISAALNPESSDYYYFVAKGDGSHHFSKSLKEHNQAVAQYQLRKRNDS